MIALRIDHDRQTTVYQGRRRTFTGNEWRILSALAAANGDWCSAASLGIDHSRAAPAVNRIRIKLGPGTVASAYGLGYRLLVPVEKSRCPCCGQPWPEDGR